MQYICIQNSRRGTRNHTRFVPPAEAPYKVLLRLKLEGETETTVVQELMFLNIIDSVLPTEGPYKVLLRPIPAAIRGW